MNYQIIIDDYIGDWWLDTDKASIRRKLESYKGKHVDMKISSLGGSLDDGLDIRQQLLDHGDVTCYLNVLPERIRGQCCYGHRHGRKDRQDGQVRFLPCTPLF